MYNESLKENFGCMIEWVGVVINLLFSNYKSGNQIILLIFKYIHCHNIWIIISGSIKRLLDIVSLLFQ